jgi:hypothetical protein
MMTLHAFCDSTPGKWLSPAYARRLAAAGRIGFWDLDRRVFVSAAVKLGPRAWIITCDNPVIKPVKPYITKG